jgi:hypothetical protein
MSANLAPAEGSRKRWHKLGVPLLLVAGLALLLLANLHLVFVAVSSEPGCVAHAEMRMSTAGASGFTAAQSACSTSSATADRGAGGKRP